RYPWLSEQDVNKEMTPGKISAMTTLGVPYPDGYDQFALKDYDTQAQQIADGLSQNGITVEKDKEIVALIGYLQRLGTDIKMERTARVETK
ncbi:MAG: cbb3-type cytochrome c oxidase subunit II, partial [Calditrichaeota bacterium]|nr:cbb3-type cytochrome c oxidase subunit II [Calditrichota bacterium]